MDFDSNYDRESPFQPGTPVYPQFFVGRQKTISKILRYVNKVHKGETQHFFLTGKRRMGKTSLVKFVKDYLDYKRNIIGVYVSNKGNNSIETLTTRIIETLINELPVESRLSKVKKWFGKHIESIELKGNKIKFKVDNELSRSFKDYFQDYIKELYDEFPKDKKGILIIIDDINGMSDSREFADWYKKLADTLAVSNNYFLPVYFLLAGYPEKFDALVVHEESFGSIFHYDTIDCLDDGEVIEFFKYTFSQVGMEISPEALGIMVEFSSGLPLMMQQIGDSVFWICQTEYIAKEDALMGIINAADEFGLKQIRPILNQLRSENYENILQVLIENKMEEFKRFEVKKLMNISDNVLDKFLRRMIELGILESVGTKNSGEYKFSNTLYYVYFLIKSINY